MTGILITSPVAAPRAIERLAALAARAEGLMAVVDHPGVAEKLQIALAAAEANLDVIIDIDPGIARTGVASAEAAVALAKIIAASPNLEYRGVQFYCGSQQHIESYADRRAAIVERTAYLQSVIAALADAGFAPAIVTGSGTGTHRIDLDLGVFTELQAGSYVFMDKQYLDCDLTGEGGDPPFEVSLSVDARVVSANHSGLVTIDAGYKSLSTDGGVAVVQRGAPETAFFAFMGDEHAALIAPDIGDAARPGRSGQPDRAALRPDGESLRQLSCGSGRYADRHLAGQRARPGAMIAAARAPLAKRPPQQDRAHLTRGRLLDVAGELLAEVGIERISTNMIAARAGLTPPALYRYFGDKYAVLEALGRRLMERQNAVLEAWLARHAPGGIAAMADHIGDLLTQNAAVTRAEPGAVWILRALHASPQLVHVRLESHRHVTDRLTDACAPYLAGIDREKLWSRLRLAVELGFAADEMLYEEDRISADAALADVAAMLRFAMLDLTESA